VLEEFRVFHSGFVEDEDEGEGCEDEIYYHAKDPVALLESKIAGKEHVSSIPSN
jgi:hypothetical protein